MLREKLSDDGTIVLAGRGGEENGIMTAQGDTLAEELEPEFTDLKSLLEAAKNSEFSFSAGFY